SLGKARVMVAVVPLAQIPQRVPSARHYLQAAQLVGPMKDPQRPENLVAGYKPRPAPRSWRRRARRGGVPSRAPGQASSRRPRR
ncbi:MAG: hypothetical protein M3Q49_11220, partial [Actinomycetota bacterium]|nr:hypothetical protein [Actinomycetota bacterium]